MYIVYMETRSIGRAETINDVEELRMRLTREKETLVSMFLTNASHAEMAAQYSLIDKLCRTLRENNGTDPQSVQI